MSGPTQEVRWYWWHRAWHRVRVLGPDGAPVQRVVLPDDSVRKVDARLLYETRPERRAF